ncbi:hypothetical protein I3760_03G220000 [Carya illinoinensis]|nr:hypothetical protein I3760_03G220000 [Carya illinoinensis]
MFSNFSDSSPSPANTPTPETNPIPIPITSTPCPAPKPPQGKKPVSIVWQHFTKLEGGDPNNPQTKCNHCGKMYGCHYRKHGTSQLKVHLEEQCKKSPILKSLVENGQSRLDFKMADGSSGAGGPTLKGYTKYNHDECRRKLARIIVMDELPFQFVEGKGFQEFVQELEPRFVLPSRHTVAKDIKKITAVKWVRSSPSRLEKFKVAAKTAGITSKNGLCTDVPTRWNSTFLMLEAAQEYKTAFQLLGDEDIQYVKYFDEHGGSRKPNDDDWVVVSTFVDFLGLFYDVTLNISDSLYPTSYGFCQQICRVKEELEDMRRGLLYGLRLVHNQVWTELIGELAQDILKKVYDEFNAIKSGTTSKTHTPTPTPSTDTVTGPPKKKRRMLWTKTLAQNLTLVNQSTEVVSELDNYLSADMVQDDDDHFDILGWWKNASKKYPIISEIARCI